MMFQRSIYINFHALAEVALLMTALCFVGQIIPAKCKYEVLSTKIEIRLAKAEAIQWTSLEFSKDITVLQKINVSTGSLAYLQCGNLIPGPDVKIGDDN